MKHRLLTALVCAAASGLWLSSATAQPAQVNTSDSQFIGRSIDLVERQPVSDGSSSSQLFIRGDKSAPLQVTGQQRPAHIAQAQPMVADARGYLVRLTKQMPAEAVLGQEFMYQLQATAMDNVADVIVRDTVPEGAVYIRSEPAAQVNGRQLTWHLHEMDAGQSKLIQVWLRPEAEGRIGSCATISANPRACAYTMVGKPNLTISKTGPASAVLNEDVTYTITVANRGSAVARGVVVTDNVPAGMTHSSGQSTLNFTVGDLAPNQTRSMPLTLRAAARGRHTNVATANSSNAGRVSSEAVTVVQQPAIQITKVGTKEQFLGKVADYEIVVSNTGDTRLTNLTITDTAPAGTRIVAASGAVISGSQAVWRLPELGAGERRSLQISLTSATEGTHANSVTASSAEGVTASASAATLWKGISGMLIEMVDDPDPILVGTTSTYTIRITNQGTGDLVNVNASMLFPAQVTPVSASGGGAVTGQTVRFPAVSRLGGKQVITYTIIGRGAAVGDARSRLTVTEDSLNSPVVKEESTRVF